MINIKTMQGIPPETPNFIGFTIDQSFDLMSRQIPALTSTQITALSSTQICALTN